MKLKPLSNSYCQSYQNKQSFNGFIKLEMYKGFLGLPFYTSKKTIGRAVEQVEKLVETLKAVSDGQLNFYRRNPRKFNFFTQEKYDPESAAKTLFIEDNNGKNCSELSKIATFIFENYQNINLEKYEKDLFAPGAKGLKRIFNPSILQRVAFKAKPEDMIKM